MNKRHLFNILYITAFTAGLFSYGKLALAETPAVFNLEVGETKITIPQETIDSWSGSSITADVPTFFATKKTTRKSIYSPQKIYVWVESLAIKNNSDSVSGKVSITNGRATMFIPPNIGKRLDVKATTIAIMDSLTSGETSASAVVWSINPETPLSASNNLGINELVGKGKSNFKGSPKNRRHNISVGIEKLKGLVLAPGEEFSFDENICPVEKQTGYLPELVIKADGTKPEYGGGLCQVSSTIFRAAMEAGLKITQRKNHSYAVQYYAPQGTDATTYCGGVDFKFQNDMNTSILIWPYLVGNDDLVFDIYGTKDNREIVLEKPIQYDKKTNGAMKATWIRSVIKEGVTTTDTFNSIYLPPALFHKEEKLDSPKPESQPTVPTSEQTNPSSDPTATNTKTPTPTEQ